MSCDQVEYRSEQQQRVVQMEKYDVDKKQMNTTPKVFLLNNLILILYSFLTNKECMAFHLVNKNIKYNLRILPKREKLWKCYSMEKIYKSNQNSIQYGEIFSI